MSWICEGSLKQGERGFWYIVRQYVALIHIVAINCILNNIDDVQMFLHCNSKMWNAELQPRYDEWLTHHLDATVFYIS